VVLPHLVAAVVLTHRFEALPAAVVPAEKMLVPASIGLVTKPERSE
jgi:hypothetical protein